MTTDLVAKSCVPCRGGVAPLTREAAEALRQAVPGWSLLGDMPRIERRYTFLHFREALSFVTAAGEIAETEGHHPDIAFGWGYATVSVHTHAILGLHENDFILAAKYDDLYTRIAPA